MSDFEFMAWVSVFLAGIWFAYWCGYKQAVKDFIERDI